MKRKTILLIYFFILRTLIEIETTYIYSGESINQFDRNNNSLCKRNYLPSVSCNTQQYHLCVRIYTPIMLFKHSFT